ncbi:MAG: DNA recombination protein RmuC [Clostridia bacterium]|nr:DNA recombination protein RmuC [Clostridia bacterium]MBR2953258.1 DNA recombination protein RmuC [Clostridia bacterium]
MPQNDILLIISISLSVISIVIMAVVLKNSRNNKSNDALEQKLDYINKNFGDEFHRIRVENQTSNKEIREDVKKSLDEMNLRIDNMNKGNFEHREKMSEMLISMSEKNAQQSEKQNKTLEESITKMQESNEKKLEEMRVTVDEKLTATLTTRLNSSFKTVSDQLENLYKSLGEMQKLSTGVTENVTALNRVLTNVKARGTWAEVQLEGILNQTIPNMFEKNVATVPNSADRVEFAIRIPSSEKDGSDILLPVDSKFPMEDYVRLCDAADRADADAVKQARKELENRVLGEAKSIAKYIHVPNTTPFAIMYLATEGLYAEIASSRTGLPEKIQNDYNVMIAGPSTITALLNSLSMGFKTIAINEKANEVREILGAAKAQYEKFGDLLSKAKKKVDEAGKTLEDAERKNLFIQRKLKNIESIDSVSADKLLFDETDNVDI